MTVKTAADYASDALFIANKTTMRQGYDKKSAIAELFEQARDEAIEECLQIVNWSESEREIFDKIYALKSQKPRDE